MELKQTSPLVLRKVSNDGLEQECQGRFNVLHTCALYPASMLSLDLVICYLTLTKLKGKEKDQ